MEGTRDNKGRRCRGYTDHGPAETRMAAIKRADAEDILIKGSRREGTRTKKGADAEAVLIKGLQKGRWLQ